MKNNRPLCGAIFLITIRLIWIPLTLIVYSLITCTSVLGQPGTMTSNVNDKCSKGYYLAHHILGGEICRRIPSSGYLTSSGQIKCRIGYYKSINITHGGYDCLILPPNAYVTLSGEVKCNNGYYRASVYNKQEMRHICKRYTKVITQNNSNHAYGYSKKNTKDIKHVRGFNHNNVGKFRRDPTDTFLAIIFIVCGLIVFYLFLEAIYLRYSSKVRLLAQRARSSLTLNHLIEFFWSVLGGLGVVLIKAIANSRRFDIYNDVFDNKYWDGLGRYDHLDEFLLGFLITFILIWSIKKYKSSRTQKE